MRVPFLLAAAAAAVVAAAAAAPGDSLLSAPPGFGPPAPRSDAADAATYGRCLALARKDPAAAQALAERWHATGGAHPADHCLAVALVGEGHYKEAALRLESLAQAMVHAPRALRGEVLDQAAQAWLLAGDPARAYKADTAALGLKPDDPELLVDRAEAAGAAGWYEKALADLDRVLKSHPSRVDALVYRASADRALGRLDPALADIDRALKLSPDAVPALLERGNIRRLKGDLAGARRDWRRVTELAPASAAAGDARRNLARLDGGHPPPAKPAGRK
jgi:tetratricopeptide (TPR) repeat protein